MARSEIICKWMRSDEPKSALIFSTILNKSEQNLDANLTEPGHIWGYLASPEHYRHNLDVSEGVKFVKINQFYRRVQNFWSCTGVIRVGLTFYCIIHATCSNLSKSCLKHIYSLKILCKLCFSIPKTGQVISLRNSPRICLPCMRSSYMVCVIILV